MAAGDGYYDANGIYIYGEADDISLFSDLLNTGMTSVSTEVGNLDGRLTTVEGVNTTQNTRLTSLEGTQPGTAGKPFNMAAGTATVNITSGYSYGFFGTVTVTLPAGRFNVQPIITCTINSGSIGAANVSLSGTGSFTAIAHAHASSPGTSFMYQAVQMTSGSAAG
jgi:hypothetical protein